ncbi:MAG: exodeoxyribonuclease III [Candidatus Komeilibacteria bacterium CG11_big_fil_rev_8_21_14_0_20_36_20]|uniref:Exodeoxyribonuclease III n=1 Tax=Candidatus Komeilibacteria bacterium CG11_big_fil_rev_8_21_14_0_20_36_20 TaxID=1974477 RepID=A0A2H0NG59_9BACT|nr:MAG: exodeoxyribonuclease III [Candidatus Komeilibacteria bacterium CG11_big_fil_rev_8_21_14_0_20_36_20]PIR81277.1 MAG: exodeoxyribonuclease III [Candidatus Komeilibacteria bacterium CG10_big_fil_rev_8_21_14_0_10_36_65]PJC55241.1 MAG: exodeoxyribonuclease III [Candidatus Komeilibacteria bacterium CG_4_9_14_0_2_um_filter_36_13]
MKTKQVSKLTILSFNVNGIRAATRKGLLTWLNKTKPDIFCAQETKIHDPEILDEKILRLKGYNAFWNCATEKKGYSGVLTYSRLKPKEVKIDFGNNILSQEGRMQLLDYSQFYLLNSYFPHSNHELTRLPYKLKFNQAFLSYIKKLDKIKPLILTGDFNVAHQEIDLARPKDNVGNPGFTDEERVWMTKLLKSGFVDSFRYLHPQKVQYSWWSYRFNTRVNNIGWRIDYFLVSQRLAKKVKRAFILDKVKGSDHCPVGLEIKI